MSSKHNRNKQKVGPSAQEIYGAELIKSKEAVREANRTLLVQFRPHVSESKLETIVEELNVCEAELHFRGHGHRHLIHSCLLKCSDKHDRDHLIQYMMSLKGKIQGAHFILKLLTTSKFDYIRQGYLKEEATQALTAMMGKPVNLDRGLPLAKTKPSQRKKTSKEAKEYYLSRQGKGGGDHYDNKHSKDTKEDLDRELDNHIASRSASAQQAQQESDPNEEGPEEEEEEGSAASPSSSA